MVDAFTGEGGFDLFFFVKNWGRRGNMGPFFYNRGAWSRHPISNIGYGMMVSDIYHNRRRHPSSIPQQFGLSDLGYLDGY